MNQRFEFEPLELAGAYLIKTFRADDVRGSFIKDYSGKLFEENGISHQLKEVFYTVSHKGTIRAIHFQRIKEQPKLVRCITGKVYDVLVDLRRDSKTFGKWQGFWLTGESCTELFIPAGFGHGYLVVEDSIVSYKCGEDFYGEYDDGIIWNDSTINVKWPLEDIGGVDRLILSDKDITLQSFDEFRRSL